MHRPVSTLASVAGFCLLLTTAGSAGAQEPAAEKSVDLAGDARLSAPVNLQEISVTLKELTASLSAKLPLKLSADGSVALRRVSLMVANRSARRVMESVAAAAGATWRADPAGGTGYQLHQSEDDLDREARQVAASERREQQADRLRRQAVYDAIDRALAAPEDKRPPMAALLEGLSREDRDLIADLAGQPPGVISASNQSHFHRRALFAAPFSSLPAAAQASVRSIAGRPEIGTPGGPSGYAGPAQGWAELDACVAIVVTGTGVRLGIVSPDGSDIWVAPTDEIHRRGILGVDSDDDAPPELVEVMRKGPLVDLREMPAALRRKRLTFAKGMDRSALPVVLEQILDQAGVSFAADDYLRSRKTPYSWLLTDQECYTLEEALAQIAPAFGHRIQYRDAVLRAVTATPGLDLRAEPPGELVERLREISRKKTGGLTLEDMITIGRLSRMQLLSFITPLPGIRHEIRPWRLDRVHDALRFFAGLSEADRRRAESDDGLSPKQMSTEQRRAFRRLCAVGLPARKRAEDASPGFAVRRVKRGELSEEVFFTLTPERPHAGAIVQHFTCSFE